MGSKSGRTLLRRYAGRIKIIHRSWREANKSVALPEEEEEAAEGAAAKEEDAEESNVKETQEKKEVAEAVCTVLQSFFDLGSGG